VSGLQQVHVRVNDAATGKPTPCRVRFTDAEGRYYAPYGRLTEFATQWNTDVGGNVMVGGKKYAYIDGTCEIALPPGKIFVEVHKGFEYRPLQIEHQLIAGKLSLRLTLERWIDMRQEGWYSGDVRCHFLTPHAALLEGMAEDLAVVNLLAMQCLIPEVDEATEQVSGQRWAIANLLAFSGQTPALQTPGHLVVVNTLNYHPWLGRLALLNSHRVVYPLRFGTPEPDNWSLGDWCDQCHRKDGLVVWSEADWRGPEALAQAILGRLDAVEIVPAQWDIEGWPFWWYGVAWTGKILPVVGGSGKSNNLVPLGTTRTYARLEAGQEFTYRNWIEAVRAGRTVATRGPLLTLEVNGRGPGGVVEAGDLHIRATARSLMPFARLAVTDANRTLAEAVPCGTPYIAAVDVTLRVEQPAFVVARCDEDDDGLAQCAWTTPVRVDAAGQRFASAPSEIDFLLHELQLGLDRLEAEGSFENDAQRQRLRKVFEDAMSALRDPV
jgi:hypothetical protein